MSEQAILRAEQTLQPTASSVAWSKLSFRNRSTVNAVYCPRRGLSTYSIAICSKTRCICSVRILPACRRLLDSRRIGGPRRRTLATPLWVTENIGSLGQ